MMSHGPAPNASQRRPIRTSKTGHDVPRSANPLPYFRRPVTHEPEPAVSLKLQYLLGGISPFACLLFLWAMSALMHSIGISRDIIGLTTWLAFIVLVVTLFCLAMNLKGFMVGMLTAILAIPLLMFGLCGLAVAGGLLAGAIGVLR